ncbi:MAG: alpha/beta fold hydrolase [Oscillibacter sp.]|nr:alpha/beta fold hydrolase [Oscillibacter sp.]
MDIQLHYTLCGSGEPLILLHGNGEDGSYFVHQLEDFSHEFLVCAIDTRGHGGSPMGAAPFTLDQFAEDLLHFMDVHEIESADLLGFSDGGNIALLFALRHPERVKRLILNAANLYPEGLEPWLLESLITERRQLLHADTPDAAYRIALLDLMIHEPHIDPAALHALTMPALVIVGDQDIIQEEHTRLIAASLPNARLAVVPGGHDCANRNPADFNEAVWQFLAETAPQ